MLEEIVGDGRVVRKKYINMWLTKVAYQLGVGQNSESMPIA